MPEPKLPKRIIDIAHPDSVSTDPSGVPLIVTNRPVLKDPMMVNASVDKRSQDEPAAEKPSKKEALLIKKIKLEPLETVEPVHAAGPTVAPSEPKDTNLPDAAEIVEDSTTSDDTTQPTETEPNAIDVEPKADTEDAAKGPILEDDKEESAPESSDETPQGTMAIDPSAAKAAREAAEKQLALDKLAADGTYVLPINGVEKRRVKRVLAVSLLIVVVLGIAGFLLALDAGYIHIDGLSAPTDFIKN